MDISNEMFKEEAYELLGELETSLLELEEAPEDMELVGRVFRAMHTIKGSGAMFGFDKISDFTHHVESVFDRVREGEIQVTKSLVNLTLAARDHILTLLDPSTESGEAHRETGEAIIEGLQALMPPAEKEETGTVTAPLPSLGIEVTYRIRFKPDHQLLLRGVNPQLLLDELRELGECTVIVHTEAIPFLDQLDPSFCYLFWDIVLATNKGMNVIKDVFIFVEDDCELSIVPVYDEDMDLPEVDRLGNILVDRGNISREDLELILKDQSPPKIGQILMNGKKVTPNDIKSALAEQDLVKKRLSQKKNQEAASSIRVPADKLDHLVALVGELVTVQARLSQKAVNQGDSDLISIAEDVEMLTSGLRDNAMSLRMLKIGSTFSNFKRLVRDLSGELGKQIELTTSGSETELDKTVIEQLKDPLVHIIRNSIDHGIETPDVRKAAGKSGLGSIHLSAEHSGASVLITISDDGKGLDPEIIREKAVDKGIIAMDSDLSEKEILNLIFAPGFSTANQVTDVSGRGVGMDVVKKSIERLRGSIELSSILSQGTTIILKLPLTLAIIDGLLVTIGEGYFILPLSSVEECVELPREDAVNDRQQKRQILNVRGEMVPYVRLRKEYNIQGKEPDQQQVVIMKANGKRTGFVVDDVIGSHQTVIKNLGTAFKNARDISGATILGDGRVALIVDVNKIFDF